MDDIELGDHTSEPDETAEIGGPDSVFSNHIETTQIPMPHAESRLMEEDTIPYRTDFYHSRRESLCSTENLTPLEV